MSKFDMGKRAKAEKESGKKSIFDWSKAGQEVSFYKPVEGEINKFDIVPYVIKSKKHPLVASGSLEVGDPDYCLEYWVHKNVGPGNSVVLCPKKMYGKPCPICESGQHFKDAGDEDAAKACWASLRVIYNVKLKDGKMQVFDVSNHLFGKAFKAAQATMGEDGAVFLAADLDDGKTVKFMATHTKKGQMEFTEYSGINFIDRKAPVTEDNVESAIAFDECITTHTYEEIEALFHGANDEEEEEDKPAKKVHKEDDEDEKPSKKAHKEEEDEGPSCPHGHKFGKDNDDFPECEDCKQWKACVKAS
jgi:hypothetical protein